MKTIKLHLLKLVKLIIKKLIQIYSKLQMGAIVKMLETCAKLENVITIDANSTLDKLIFDIELETCTFKQVIELRDGKVEFRTNEKFDKLNCDMFVCDEEYSNYVRNVKAFKEAIEEIFLNQKS